MRDRSIQVPGYVISWKGSTDDVGNLASKVDPTFQAFKEKDYQATEIFDNQMRFRTKTERS